MAEGLSPPRWARDENATTPTPEGDGSCGHAFRWNHFRDFDTLML